MATPEGRVKARVKVILKRFKNVWWYMPVSAGYGKHGVPDFIICANGKFLGVECKAANATVTSLQSQQAISINTAGGHWLLINDHNIEYLDRYLLLLGAQPHEAAT